MAPTAATLAIIFATGIYGVFYLAAPAFAAAAGNAEAAPVVRLLALIIVIDGVTAVRSAALMRNFQQGRLIVANSVGLVANAAIAITPGGRRRRAVQLRLGAGRRRVRHRRVRLPLRAGCRCGSASTVRSPAG